MLAETKAQELHELGQRLSDEGKEQEAISAYLQAIELDPKKSESFYNIGLIYKYQNEWTKSFEYNQKAYSLDPSDESARWNLAIAATALRDWATVRQAWQDNGIALDGKSGPIDMNFGITPVRLNPDYDAEVVWATRIDPVRARIENVPYKESGFRYDDIVLHDGAAVGYRKNGNNEYPVFNVLELFERSKFSTALASIQINSEQDIAVLENLFSKSVHHFEDWTKNVRTLCRQCSEGMPHEHHDSDLTPDFNHERTLGVAVREDESILPIFEEWQRLTGGKLLSFNN
ncbi:tetratricopeptide repeat protein [Aquirhabdus parva]|uniref:Tetratricopeptide repeat protein n=1 Tax=Aquirhabdus parva TaxID=2283318 RepID=A0A345P8K6_9GAMM|nr:tetratricopeptide repeat protein [Aquirhabdus parva]AXI03615.1 tetratricopeptide repeat protein [Aquirhabdus parva]